MRKDCDHYKKCIELNNYRCPPDGVTCLTKQTSPTQIISMGIIKDQTQHYTYKEIREMARYDTFSLSAARQSILRRARKKGKYKGYKHANN